MEQCTQCSHEQIAYNSCRNRHCPKCQAAARKEWTQKRAAEVLPVEYFHVVFTLPEQLSPLALQNKRVIYGLLFQAASETLLKIAGDPKHLGASIGFLAVLHTWGQTLQHHPHLHCVIVALGRRSDVPMEGLCGGECSQGDDTRRERVHPAVLAPCTAARVCENPPLWTSRQPLSQ